MSCFCLLRLRIPVHHLGHGLAEVGRNLSAVAAAAQASLRAVE